MLDNIIKKKKKKNFFYIYNKTIKRIKLIIFFFIKRFIYLFIYFIKIDINI